MLPKKYVIGPIRPARACPYTIKRLNKVVRINGCVDFEIPVLSSVLPPVFSVLQPKLNYNIIDNS